MTGFRKRVLFVDIITMENEQGVIVGQKHLI